MLTKQNKHIIRRAIGRFMFADRVDPMAQRLEMQYDIQDLQKDDKIAVIFAGVDCDGSAYTGNRYVVPARVMYVLACLWSYQEQADGPFSWRLASPDEKIERTSRDLALEAFENGHPHVIYI